MAIDPSIAAGQAPNGNLLQTLAGVTQLRGVQQQQQANVAASRAYREATDPVTGQIDYNRLTSLLSQGDAAYNLPQIQGQVNEARNSQLTFDKNTLELAQKRIGMLSNGFGGLIASGNITPQSVMQIASQGIRQGLFTPDEAVSFTADMPTDPAQLQGWAKQKWLGFSDNADKLKTLMPQTQILNTGGQQQVLAIDPLTGRPTTTGVAQNTLSPEAAARPVAAYDERTGKPINIPTSEFVKQSGGQPGSTVGLPGTGTNGRYPSQQPGGVSQAPSMGVQSGPALGQTAAAEAVGKVTGEQAGRLQSAAEGSQQRVYFLQDMMMNLPKFDSGPTADWTAKAKALALQLAPETAQKLGVDPQSVASKEEFAKFATNLAINTASGLGGGTDAQLAAAISGNPSAHLSQLGNEQIMKVLIGTERATQAKNAAWQSRDPSIPDAGYGKWSSKWNSEIDPRVFVTPEMSQAEVSKMYKGLKPADQARFKTSLRTAIDAGIIPNPVGQ